MTYDRADWHHGGDFPAGLPPEHGATHIGMYLAWAIKRGFVGSVHLENSPAAVDAVRAGTKSGRQFLMEQCDEKFWPEDLDDEGNRFTASYYESQYANDYAALFGNTHRSLYMVEDSASNQSRLEQVLDERLAAWRRTASPRSEGSRPPRSGKPWWRFW